MGLTLTGWNSVPAGLVRHIPLPILAHDGKLGFAVRKLILWNAIRPTASVGGATHAGIHWRRRSVSTA